MKKLCLSIVFLLISFNVWGCEIFNALDAEKAITEFLLRKYPDKQWQVTLDQPKWALKVTTFPVVERVDITRNQDRFEAWLSSGAGELHRITGKLTPVIDVPVLARAISPGDIICEQDVITEPIRTDQMGHAIITNRDHLIGQTARHRILKPYIPIAATELTSPKIIRKGSEVSLILRTPHIILTQRRAQALEDGAIGDRIKVCNLESKRVVMGIVKDANHVEVPHAG
jgi:flagella basal body P-ring formation protein FlgA